MITDMKSTPLITVVIPTYNGSLTIKDTLDSIVYQDHKNVEIIISDDNSTDNTLEICQTFKNKLDITIYKNLMNEGYSKNVNKGFKYSNGDFIFLLGQDDLIAKRGFELIKKIIENNPEVTCISRPYFWFESNPFKIVRQKKRLVGNDLNFTYVNMSSELKLISNLVSTTDQLSGLVFKKSAVSHDFHEDIFTSHVYPFTSCFVSGEAVIVPYNFIAVRIESSQARNISSVYDKSPIISWKVWLDTFFPIDNYPLIHKYLIRHLIVNFGIGLLQIRNYSSKSLTYTLREVFFMIKFRWLVIFNVRFILVLILILSMPKKMLRVFVDLTKRSANRLIIKRNFKSFPNLDSWRESAVPENYLGEVLSSARQRRNIK
jgi:glycosyltransferase involved in cell wall biosynthesis